MSKIKTKEAHEEAGQKKSGSKIGLVITLLLLLIIGGCVGIWYYIDSQKRIYIEKAEINAPIISLSPMVPGILDKLFVEEGDSVREDMIIARIGETPLKSKTEGIVVYTLNTPGQLVSSQTPVVKMFDPKELRVIGRVEEDKGLQFIKPGQKAMFTADAFGSKKYEGVVDSVSVAARQSDIVFSISDKRQVREFEVKIKYDTDRYPELKNGMSSKIWIYK